MAGSAAEGDPAKTLTTKAMAARSTPATMPSAAGLFLNAAVTNSEPGYISWFQGHAEKGRQGLHQAQAAAGVGSSGLCGREGDLGRFFTAAGRYWSLRKIGNPSFAKTNAGLVVKSDGAADVRRTQSISSAYQAGRHAELAGGTELWWSGTNAERIGT